MRAELLERYRSLALPDDARRALALHEPRGVRPRRLDGRRVVRRRRALDARPRRRRRCDDRRIWHPVSEVSAAGIRFEPLTDDHPLLGSLVKPDDKLARPQRGGMGAWPARPRSRRGRARQAALPARRERRPGWLALLARARRRRARLPVHARPGAHLGRRAARVVRRTASSRSSSRDGAKAEIVNLQRLSSKAWLFASCHARVERDAELDWVEGGFGSARARSGSRTTSPTAARPRA